ncbi:putative baseplate assembly protein [Candidatus Acetothermia bacterium]|nr:putative baseplate assembly protein [Candidatus Acetothermia bacterium]
MKFDFSTLGGFADQVQFEFLNGIDTVNNISINDEPIQFQNFNDGSHKIAANVNFTIRTTKINPRLSKGIATLSGPIHTLLIGGSAGFEIDNIVARCSYPKGLIPDKAFANSESLDLTKAFYPLGQNPRPGNAFYFTSKEIFSKPKARVQVFMSIAPTPEQNLNIQPGKNATTTKTPLSHSIVWEYWNGKDWNIIPLIPKGMQTSKPDFENGGLFEFEVPEDMAVLKVNDQEAKWMRARLESGGYGFTAKVTWLSSTFGSSLATGPAATTNEFTYVVNQPPALADFRLCYTWQYGPVYPDHVLTYNDFQYEDHTYEARWPGSTFSPFKIVKDVTPELYLGFDKKLPVDRLGLYFDIMEKRGETQGPAMLWEYWDGFEWQRLSAEDETQHLRVPGILSFIAAEDSQPLARFGTELHWLRGRLKEDGPPGEPTINGIFPNAVWVSQRRTLNDVPLGISNGLPNQALNFTQIPVLPGERIEVRELIGPRANVEWRILAQEIFKTNPTSIIKELEEMLGREGDQIDIVKDDLRLRRDRNKRVTEAWVHWQGQPHLFFSTPDDRHYVVDRARGKLFFGDGTNGKVPPAGAAVSAKQYRAGGGLVGNVAAQTIKQLMGGVPGIQDVSNPEPAEGGADGETLEAFSLRGPQTIRHRGRAIAPSDYETLAHEASPAVAVARAIPTHNTSGRVIPGWVTLIIIPQSQELRPWPSFGLRQQVRQFIEEHAPADLAASSHIYVTGPDYFPIDVAATIAPIDPAEAGAVEKRARDALEEFLHPLRGGPDKRGWELGRDVFLSDVASVLERVEGVDYVEEVSLMLNGVPQGEQIAVADDRIVVAGEIRLKLKAAEA